MRRRARWWRPAVVVTLGVLTSCAAVRRDGESYVVRAKGYRVGAPVGWTPIASDGDLALRRRESDGGLMAQASCAPPVSTRPLPILTRHLRFGLRDVHDLVEEPVTLDGLPGTASRFRARLDGTPVGVRAVTLVGGGCVYDLVAVAAPEQVDAIGPAFEQFIQGFGRFGSTR